MRVRNSGQIIGAPPEVSQYTMLHVTWYTRSAANSSRNPQYIWQQASAMQRFVYYVPDAPDWLSFRDAWPSLSFWYLQFNQQRAGCRMFDSRAFRAYSSARGTRWQNLSPKWRICIPPAALWSQSNRPVKRRRNISIWWNNTIKATLSGRWAFSISLRSCEIKPAAKSEPLPFWSRLRYVAFSKQTLSTLCQRK